MYAHIDTLTWDNGYPNTTSAVDAIIDPTTVSTQPTVLGSNDLESFSTDVPVATLTEGGSTFTLAANDLTPGGTSSNMTFDTAPLAESSTAVTQTGLTWSDDAGTTLTVTEETTVTDVETTTATFTELATITETVDAITAARDPTLTTSTPVGPSICSDTLDNGDSPNGEPETPETPETCGVHSTDAAIPTTESGSSGIAASTTTSVAVSGVEVTTSTTGTGDI